ncbi:hypothetical protein JXC34_07530, partial [Candidatus Woesearchaeota archaeon]|nr:hypothetical protein [Candidatus Woesearchaeota archaeon]
FNDIDLDYYNSLPIISPELNLEELSEFKNKKFICLVHGDIVLMTTKNMIKADEIIDERNNHFKIRKYPKHIQILNSKQLGLFTQVNRLTKAGINNFYIDCKDSAKYVRIYRKILEGKDFDDKKIRKGYTTGHYFRGVQ